MSTVALALRALGRCASLVLLPGALLVTGCSSTAHSFDDRDASGSNDVRSTTDTSTGSDGKADSGDARSNDDASNDVGGNDVGGGGDARGSDVGVADIAVDGRDSSGTDITGDTSFPGDTSIDIRDGGPALPDTAPDTTPPGAMLTIAPLSGPFGQVVVNGTSGSISFTVTNSGAVASASLGTAIAGTDASSFVIAGGDCAQAILPPGGSCKVDVQFKPTQIGMRSATLSVTGATPLSAALSGEGLARSALSASPATGDFKGIPISGATPYADIAFMISNTGAQTSGALTTAITGTDAAAFAIQTDGCVGKQLGQGMACALTVRFTPGTRGAKVAALNVQGMPGGVLPVSLTGKGDAPATFTILPATSDLPAPVDINTPSAAVNLTVANAGDVAGTVTPTSSDTTTFSMTNGCSGVSVAPGKTCTVGVQFAPTVYGPKSTTVTVAPGVTGQNTAVVNGVGRDLIALNVAVAGNGTGSVTAAGGIEGNGINCPGDCAERYARTTGNPVVKLTANYNAASTNVAWSAPCAGSMTTCDVTLSAAATVTVTFTVKRYTLTVTRSSEATAATGTVTGPGIACGTGSCSAMFNHGETVALTAQPAAGFYFSTWTGGGCSGGALKCTTAPLTGDTTVDAKFTLPNVIFVTSTVYSPGQFRTHDPMGQNDPLRGADAYCRERAAAGSAGTMANRTFTSIITVDNGGWPDRLAGKRGWVRADGKPFGDDTTSIVGNQVWYPPALDENGAIVEDVTYPTLGSGCVNWTSVAAADYRTGGVPTGGGGAWDHAFGIGCSSATRLYCMSIDYTATVTAGTPTPGRKVFITDGVFVPSGSSGLAAADALCQTEATAASYTGTFRAFLSSFNPQTSAYGRLNASGAIWVRPDGIPIVASPTDLNTDDPHLIAPIQVSPTLISYGHIGAWTGAGTAITAGVAANTCTPNGGTSWTAGAVTGITGSTGRISLTRWGFVNASFEQVCNASGMRLYCFEQ